MSCTLVWNSSIHCWWRLFRRLWDRKVYWVDAKFRWLLTFILLKNHTRRLRPSHGVSTQPQCKDHRYRSSVQYAACAALLFGVNPSRALSRQGSFRGGTVFPLVKCLRTPKMHRIAGFCIYSHTISPGIIPPWTSKRSQCLEPDTNFCLAQQRSHCSCFTKWPLCRDSWETCNVL